jgi:hypothetical protein
MRPEPDMCVRWRIPQQRIICSGAALLHLMYHLISVMLKAVCVACAGSAVFSQCAANLELMRLDVSSNPELTFRGTF